MGQNENSGEYLTNSNASPAANEEHPEIQNLQEKYHKQREDWAMQDRQREDD